MSRARASARFALTAVMALSLTVAEQQTAVAGATPGTYAYWIFDDAGGGLSDVVHPITIVQHPGQQSQVFWSNQVGWTNDRGGYAGLQTNARNDTNLFLFSVWDATEARAGSPGSWCEKFTGEGEGMSCRIEHRITAGKPYRFRFRAEGSGWWGVTVSATGASFKLGSIKVGSDRMKANSTGWVEYYRWSDPRSSCWTEPYSRALFGKPTAENGTRTARFTGGEVNGCPGFPKNGATVVQTAAGAKQTLGIGNSVMGPITGPAGKCADVAAAAVIAYHCHGGGNQAWVMSHDGTARAKDYSCLDVTGGGTADDTPVGTYACHGGGNQQWRPDGQGRLLNTGSGKCLDTRNGATTDGTPLVIRTCSTAPTQRWTAPARVVAQLRRAPEPTG
jgi:hypothetical protein